MCETNYNIHYLLVLFLPTRQRPKHKPIVWQTKLALHVNCVCGSCRQYTRHKIAHLHNYITAGAPKLTIPLYVYIDCTVHNTANRFHFVTSSCRERCSVRPTNNEIFLQVLCSSNRISNCNVLGWNEPLTFNSWLEFSGQQSASLGNCVFFQCLYGGWLPCCMGGNFM